MFASCCLLCVIRCALLQHHPRRNKSSRRLIKYLSYMSAQATTPYLMAHLPPSLIKLNATTPHGACLLPYECFPCPCHLQGYKILKLISIFISRNMTFPSKTTGAHARGTDACKYSSVCENPSRQFHALPQEGGSRKSPGQTFSMA